jgi:hypothetical protein
MKALILGLSLATGFVGSATAMNVDSAAQLKRIDGSVLVNKGQNYRTAMEGMPLQVGDRVMIMDGSTAIITYWDGCVAEFKQNQIITIEEVSTCEGGSAASISKSPMYAEPMGGSLPLAGTSSSVAGGAAAAVGAAGFVVTNDKASQE